MLRNPEIRRMLAIAVPLCAVFTALCLWLDFRAGLLTAVLSLLLITLYLLEIGRAHV